MQTDLEVKPLPDFSLADLSVGAAWSLGFISATIPFVAKENGAWPPLLLQVLKRI